MSSASGAGGRWFDSRPCHSKGIEMAPVATSLGAQHYKARNGFSSLNKNRKKLHHITNKNEKSAKLPDNVNCIPSSEGRMEDWQSC